MFVKKMNRKSKNKWKFARSFSRFSWINKTPLNRKDFLIQYLDQGISSITNYSPMFLLAIIQNWSALGVITLFQSFYSLFVGVTRSALGSTSLMNENKDFGRSLQYLAVSLGIFGGIITFLGSKHLGTNNLLYLFLMPLPLLEETLRFQAFAYRRHLVALKADSIWLIVLFVSSTYTFSNMDLTASTLLLLWSCSSLPSVIYLLLIQKPGAKHRASIFNKIYLVPLGQNATSSVLAEMNTIFINSLITITCGPGILGQFRYYQLCLIPVAFLIGANRIILIPLYVNQKFIELRKILKSQFYLRIFLYCIGVIFSSLSRGLNNLDMIIWPLTVIAIEMAYQRYTIFQKLIATNHSNLVRNLTIQYFLSSLLIFSVSVQVGSVFSLVVSLLCVEFLTWALTHKMNKDFQ